MAGLVIFPSDGIDQNHASDNCLVLRDGSQVSVVASEIVPGDILYIKSGNKLSADVWFVEISTGAKFDRSILTGR